MRLRADDQSVRQARAVEAICAACVRETLVDGAAVSVMTPAGSQSTAGSTDPVAARLAEAQFDLGEGPSVDAFASGAPVLIADLSVLHPASAGRWAGFTAAAVDAGALAVFALPLQLGAVRLGALVLYRREPGHLDESALTIALRAADAVALALLDLRTPIVDGISPVSPLERIADASFYRIEVHQATGMIMGQLDTGLDDALVRLRATAYAEGRPVAAVAADVVARRRRFEQND